MENFRSKDIVVTGNTVIDALLEAASWDTTFANPKLQEATASDKRMVVVTTHRRENLDAMKEIGGAVQDLAKASPEIYFALPLHLNPAVRQAVLPEVENLDNVIITNPLPYDQFTKLQGRATMILTDSAEEEAPSLGKPVLVMRQNTERPEAVVAGTVKLVGTNRSLIVAERSLLDDQAAFEAMANAVNPYGDGKGAERSVAAIGALLGLGERKENFSPRTEGTDERIPRFEEIVSSDER